MISGLRSGLLSGLRSGLNPPMGLSGVEQDATSGKYWPSSSGQWSTTLAAAGIGSGGPSRLWLMQEAAGSPADSIGSTTLTPNGSVTLNQTIAGWTRKAINIAEGGASYLGNNSDTGLPDVSTTAALLIAYVAITATPLAERTMAVLGNGNGGKANVTTGPFPRLTVGGSTSATGATSVGTSVFPLVVKVDAPNSTARLYTLDNKVAPTWTAPASAKAIFIGGVVELAPPMSVLCAAQFEGSAAQLADASIKTLLQTLGWSPTWS